MLFVTLIIINSRLIPRLQMSKTGKRFFYEVYCQNLMVTKNKDKQLLFIHKKIKASKTTSLRTGLR